MDVISEFRVTSSMNHQIHIFPSFKSTFTKTHQLSESISKYQFKLLKKIQLPIIPISLVCNLCKDLVKKMGFCFLGRVIKKNRTQYHKFLSNQTRNWGLGGIGLNGGLEERTWRVNSLQENDWSDCNLEEFHQNPSYLTCTISIQIKEIDLSKPKIETVWEVKREEGKPWGDWLSLRSISVCCVCKCKGKCVNKTEGSRHLVGFCLTDLGNLISTHQLQLI